MGKSKAALAAQTAAYWCRRARETKDPVERSDYESLAQQWRHEADRLAAERR